MAHEPASAHAAHAPEWEVSVWPFVISFGILFALPLAFAFKFVYEMPFAAILALGVGTPLIVAGIAGWVKEGMAGHHGEVIPRFILWALAGRPPLVFGDGRQTRDFVYVADNVRMTLAAAEGQRSWGEVINVGSGREASILDLAVLINGVAGTKGQDALKFLPARNREVARRLASTKKMAELVGVKSEFSLAEGIKKTIEERRLNDLWSEEPLRIMAVGA